MKVVAIVPPAFLPDMNYFQMMYVVDELYIDDEGKYTRHSWQDGNRIRTNDGLAWLRVPVVRPVPDAPPIRMKDAEIDYRSTWWKVHLKAIAESYRDSPHFQSYYPKLESVLIRGWKYLAELDVALLEEFFKPFLELETPLIRTSTVDYDREGTDPTIRLKRFLEKVGATTFVEFEGGKKWIDEGVLKGAGIELRWLHPETDIYIQLHPGWDGRVSALDTLFCIGPMATGFARKVEWHDAEVLEDHRDGDFLG